MNSKKEQPRTYNNNLAKKLVDVFNHGFDANAHTRGLTEQELFKEILNKVSEMGLNNVTEADVLHALGKAEGAHLHLLSRDQAGSANEAVDRLTDLFGDWFSKNSRQF
jgi:ADP-dependent phosphofructokinase/glucokinase